MQCRAHLLLSTALLLSACEAPVATPATTTASAPRPAPAAATPGAQEARLPVAGASPYRCEDGRTLQVRFGPATAELQWPDGRAAKLPRAESASRGGGDVYVGQTVSLQRDGDRIELHDDGSSATTCLPSTPTG